jgi:cell division protein FtsI/penicillin-binding protein 2
LLALCCIAALLAATAPAASARKNPPKKPVVSALAKKKKVKTRAPARYRWVAPPIGELVVADQIDGEDPVVRRAAVEALTSYSGTVVVSDPYTGRILAMVNQPLALKSGFKPCSTIKVVAALAALSEGIIERSTMLRVSRRVAMNLTEALARSNNPFFSNLGLKLGYDRIAYYSKLFGLGEKAGLDIPGEQAGEFPSPPLNSAGVGMMMSFGYGIALTPLQLSSLLGAIANGGTLYYLQHPRTHQEAETLTPRVKRHLDIQPFIPDVKPGLLGAVEYGTAQRAAYDVNEPVFGKTGTCTDATAMPTHMGWFGSFSDTGRSKLVVVVMLTGGRRINGPVAAGVAGNIYRALAQNNYFAETREVSPTSLVSTQTCCSN